jgi:hypothetical protein
MDEDIEEVSEIEQFRRLNHLFSRVFISTIIAYGKVRGFDYKSVDLIICPESLNYSVQVEEFFNPETNDHRVRITKIPESIVTH